MDSPQEVGGGVRTAWLLFLLLLGALELPGATYYVAVAGVGGEPDYEQRFTSWVQDLDKTLRESGPDTHVRTLTGAEATRDQLRPVLREIGSQASEDDAVAVMLIGHGTFDGYEYKFNLPGPDITAVELASLLDGVKARRQLVAVMTSASGAALTPLQTPNRTVVTATKSGTERNAVVFARYWVAALQDAATDTDKNEVISALEAFLSATRKTADFYASQQRLATEHPVFEDTGAGEGVREPSVESGEGLKASQFALLRIGKTQLAAQDPAKRELLDRKESLEQEIDKLKYEKAAMPTDEYRTRLTQLLVELARTQEELDK